MRILRRQLMDLLEEARHQQGIEELPKRLQSALLHDTLKLLPHPGQPSGKKRIDLRYRTISHGALHRHLVTVRCPDQAFYLDAIKGYFLRSDIQPISQQTMVAAMQCDDEMCDVYLRHPDQHSDDNFMFITLHLSATLVPDCTTICHDIRAILRAVDLSVCDFEAIQEKLTTIAEKVRVDHPPAAELLDWMNQDKYLFFGLKTNGRRLGLLRDYRAMNHVSPDLRKEIEAIELPTAPGIEWLHLAACQHYLYSASNVKVLSICWHDREKKLKHAILIGHFSRSARHANASQVPCLRQHWHALEHASILQHSAFYRREIRTLYDRLPKPLLHSLPAEKWLLPLKNIVDLTSPTRTSTSHLKPAAGNLDYLLIAMPSNRFGPNVLRHIKAEIQERQVTIHGSESFGIGPYRIIILAIQIEDESKLEGIEDAVNQCIIFWKDRAKKTLLAHADEINLPDTLRELETLPPLYQNLFPPVQFLADIQARESVLSSCRTMVRVHQRQAGKCDVELHIITCKTMHLGELVDRIQAFGLIAIQEAVVDFGDQEKMPVRISSIRCNIRCNRSSPTGHDNLKRLRRGLELVFNGEADHDSLNALITSTALDIDQVGILIALRNHLVQIMADAAPMPLSEMLLHYPLVAERLLHLFAALHLPSMPSNYFAQVKLEFEQALTDVHSLTEDRWFRALAELVEAGVRTNAFVRQTGDPIAFKINPALLHFAPSPLPYREIFVHGVHVEGIHLRAGAIARGGIRFSDRSADFRTEVLELMSTQVVKNGQIIPTGAKGGFVVRDGSDAEFVLTQYRIFIRTLLEMTDNLLHGEAIAPDGIRIAEEDQNDPYFVVAADKGTARFSDDANSEARLAQFWLDDAFASGGSHGYDHKIIGITARGAWVCAAHHFELLGKDAYRDPIRVVAIGDMGGDVFGNGMLLNPEMLLIAAFNHRHIFLDPNPNAKQAFAERKRLFKTVSGWDQYDVKLVSRGGGIFERNSKSIPLREEARKALDVDATSLSGEALIQAILKANVDMLYNGGIGTYVKASSETDHQVQDPANNSVRIDANQLRATVVCEGGNLGFTQRARIEFAQKQGIINTDAIDNSAGVDMSDHEVNLKILFSTPALIHTSISKRNSTLKQVEAVVTRQCLDNNLLQSRALTLALYDAVDHYPRLSKLRDRLIADRRLDLRSDPGMNDDNTLTLHPQLSVLLGHEKNRIHEALNREQFHARSCFSDHLLKSYFPDSMWRRFSHAMGQHPLATEIIHTQASNHIINHIGLVCIHHLQTLLDQPASTIVQGLLLAERVLDADRLLENIWATVEDKSIAARIQHEIQEQIIGFTEELLRLSDVHELDMAWIQKQRRGLRRFYRSVEAQGIGGAESSRYLEKLKTASQAGLTATDAAHLAAMPEMTAMATAVHTSTSENIPLSRCIKATQACMHLLPFPALESSLHSPLWADEEAHALRKEWLHRLTMLKQRATHMLLLQHKSRPLLERGRLLWSQHRQWQYLQDSIRLDSLSGDATDESEKLRLILTLTHLESVIDESRE